MDRRQAREWAEALAYLGGYLRDEPVGCPNCSNFEYLVRNEMRQVFFCQDCRLEIAFQVAQMQREERMRERVMKGVGGPLVKAYGDEESVRRLRRQLEEL